MPQSLAEAANDADPQRMQCMEVWGGNQAAQRSVETPGLKVWVYSRPFGQAVGGGDVYYLSSCASGRITRILLADVSGHGEIVSQVAVGLRSLMRQNVNYIKQTRFVRAMNQQFADYAKGGGFATALVSTFFSPTQSFSFCNAGHPPPMLFRNATSEWEELESDSINTNTKTATDTPLGIVGEANYRQREMRLETGDMVLSFSDAITESVDAERRQLGQAGILQLLRELRVTDPGEVIPAIVQQIQSFSADNLRQDDTTILLCRATGGSPSLKNNLLAPLRFFGSVADHTKLG